MQEGRGCAPQAKLSFNNFVYVGLKTKILLTTDRDQAVVVLPRVTGIPTEDCILTTC
jgi:hypothetical protein